MKRELLKINNKETTVQISNTQVKAVRNKDITKVCARVYDDNKIGVAGQYGDGNLEELYKKAENNLKLNINYPCEISNNINIKANGEKLAISSSQIIGEVKNLIENLNVDDFVVNGTVSLASEELQLSNEENLDCYMKSESIEFGIYLKEKGSPNIIDTGYMIKGKEFDKELIISEVQELCKAHKNKLPLNVREDGKVRCIFNDGSNILNFFSNELNGKAVGTNSSAFNNKFDEKLFSEDVTLYEPNDIDDGGLPFDMEGTARNGEGDALISNGVLCSGYADKRTAKKYNLKETGNGFSDFDGVPSTVAPVLSLKKGNKTIKELLNGEEGILLIFAEGGDFTNHGGYGTPVQAGYVFDGEKLIGIVDEFSIASNVYKMFGEDFIGVASQGLNRIDKGRYAVIDMKVN